jgi:serine protease Do
LPPGPERPDSCCRLAQALVTFLTAVLLLLTGCCQRPVPHPQDGESIQPDNSRTAGLAPASSELPSFIDLFEKAKGSVVNVSAAHPLPIPEELLPRREEEFLRALVRSLGSGFVFDDQGHVATCSSVVQDAEKIEVILANGRHLDATLVGADEITDLAVLSIPAAHAPEPLVLGKSGSLKAGDWVAAFGYPFGLSHTITAGIVSAHRTAAEMESSHGIILSDASINPGCNGGPLLDTEGKVVGINLIPGQIEGGMGLAIPIDDAKKLLAMLKEGRAPRHPWLGVSIQHVNAELARSFGLDQAEGALVSRVQPGGPAARAGLKRGDIVITFAGRPVLDPLALIELVKSAPIGRKVRIEIIRKGKRQNLRIEPIPAP